MTTYYAVADANGLISHMLEADTLSDAIDELRDAIDNGTTQEWVDAPAVDLEDACEVDGTNKRYNDTLDACRDAGAKFEWGDNTSDSWDIWSYDEPTLSPIDDVAGALKNIVEIHIDNDEHAHITDYAPDSSDPEYGGVTEPGSAWDEECDRRIAEIRAALPNGWSAEWSDNDVTIERA